MFLVECIVLFNTTIPSPSLSHSFLILFRFKLMANKRFTPHLPKILVGNDINDIYELWGVDYAVKISLPDGETPETVRPRYCGAYMSHFKNGGLSFPLPHFGSVGGIRIGFRSNDSQFLLLFLNLLDSS